MNLIKQLINIGTDSQKDPVYNKHIRFTNSVFLIVSFFVVQSASIAIYYNELVVLFIFLVHWAFLSGMLVFTYLGKRVLASAWFSGVAIVFVTFYAIAFTVQGLNFVFLPMIIFLQFFLFSAAEKKYIIIFISISLLCFVVSLLWSSLNLPQLLPLSSAFIEAQRLNSLIGLPMLNIAFGMYSFHTIHRAEQEVVREKENIERLLLNILPKSIAERFKHDQSYMAEGYESVTVLFADIVGFTTISEKIAPAKLVAFLNDIFSKFDELTEKFQLEKIKTIGDAYMVAGGVPIRFDNHTQSICRLALGMRDIIQNIQTPNGETLNIRIGINTGPVTAGVIGIKKFTYDLWGDAVNTASRMESHSENGMIQITDKVYNIIKDEFDCEARGTIQVKGKGAMNTYFLVKENQ